MRGGERLAKANRQLARPSPLLLQLVDSLLQLRGHAVERLGHLRELVPPVHVDPLAEAAARDLVGGLSEPAEGADDRDAEHVHERTEHQDDDPYRDDEPPARRRDRGGELTLRYERCKLDAAAGCER